MKLKIHNFIVACLIASGIILSACVSKLNQSINLIPSPTLATSTPTIPTSTLTVSPTMNLNDLYIAMLTTTPTAPPLPTLPSDCGTVKLGSAGTQTIDNTQKILVQGTAILCGQTYVSIVGSRITATILEGLIDLDTGTFNVENADFWFCPGEVRRFSIIFAMSIIRK